MERTECSTRRSWQSTTSLSRRTRRRTRRRDGREEVSDFVAGFGCGLVCGTSLSSLLLSRSARLGRSRRAHTAGDQLRRASRLLIRPRAPTSSSSRFLQLRIRGLLSRHLYGHPQQLPGWPTGGIKGDQLSFCAPSSSPSASSSFLFLPPSSSCAKWNEKSRPDSPPSPSPSRPHPRPAHSLPHSSAASS